MHVIARKPPIREKEREKGTGYFTLLVREGINSLAVQSRLLPDKALKVQTEKINEA